MCCAGTHVICNGLTNVTANKVIQLVANDTFSNTEHFVEAVKDIRDYGASLRIETIDRCNNNVRGVF